ncbi:MAG: hypothetical protein KJO43_03400 [Phycisphaerae bacterium]|nr:hypothetical protein [Phycisphaerae bacterium]
MRTLITLASCVFVLAATAIVGGCDGQGYRVRLRIESETDLDCPAVLEDTVSYRGRDFHLVDSNCDDRPDLACDVESGLCYRIQRRLRRPGEGVMPDYLEPDVVPPSDIAFDPSGPPPPDAASLDPETETDLGWSLIQPPGFDTAFAFDFSGRHADQWLAYFGVDQLGSTPAIITGIHADYDEDAEQLEIVLPYSTSLPLPDPRDFDVRFELQGLIDATGPGFLVVRVAGATGEVIAFLLAATTDGSLWAEFIDDADVVWEMEADAVAGLAIILRDGVPFATIDLPLP